jgi:hypothetical protein
MHQDCSREGLLGLRAAAACLLLMGKIDKKIFIVSCCLLTHAQIERKAYHVGACCLLLLACCYMRPPRTALVEPAATATRLGSRPLLARAHRRSPAPPAARLLAPAPLARRVSSALQLIYRTALEWL